MDPITNDETARREWERDKEEVAQLAEDAAVRAGQAAGRAAGEASRRLRSATDRASAAYDRTAREAGRAYRNVRDYAALHPGATAAVTFGTGVCLGMWMARGRELPDYRRGIVPIAAIALANAVLEVFGPRR